MTCYHDTSVFTMGFISRTVFVFLLLGIASLSAQQPEKFVEITGDVKTPLRLTITELEKLPQANIQTQNDGIAVNYQGVWLHEILAKAGVPAGTEIRGKALTNYVLAEAEDGYQALYSLAELSPMFTDNQVLLAYKADGKPLVGAQGAFRLVAPKDKRGARSVRMLTRLQVVQLRK